MRAFRLGGIGFVTALTIAACNPRKADNIPLEAAMFRTPVQLMEERVRVQPEPPAGLPATPIEIGGRQWMASAAEYALPESMVRPVMPVQGVVFHSLAWDEDPFDRLLVEDRPGVWREFLELR